MKKLILIAVTGAVLISSVLIGSFAAGSAAVSDTAASRTAEEKAYVISVDSGRVAVFRDGEDKPFMVTDTFVNSLPKTDRLELENGVRVSGERELRQAIEDYCS